MLKRISSGVLIFSVFFAILAGSMGMSYAAGTKDKCSCDLEAEGDKNDGAEVSNAAACFFDDISKQKMVRI